MSRRDWPMWLRVGDLWWESLFCECDVLDGRRMWLSAILRVQVWWCACGCVLRDRLDLRRCVVLSVLCLGGMLVATVITARISRIVM